jgi:tetratricopeptide (TPR) repeat protein/DNA-binding CsgD family transcriptional regulator
LFFFLISVFVHGLLQPAQCAEDKEVDKLLFELSIEDNDTIKVDILIKLAENTSWSDIKASEQYAKEALYLSQQINYEKGLAYANYWLAKIYVDYEFDLSESLLRESLELAKKTNDSILIAMVYNVLGILKTVLHHHEDALAYYNQSLDIYLDHKQDSSSAAIYNNLGVLHGQMYDDSISIDYYVKAAEINKRTKNYLWLSINYVNIGYRYVESGNLQKALNYLQMSNDIIEEHNFNRLYPLLYNNFSYYNISVKDYKKSIDFANKALVISKDQGNKLQERDALRRLKESYFNMSDFINAYKYAEQIQIVSDSINKHNRLKEFDLLEMRYKFEDERKAQKLEQALLEAKHYSKERIYVFIILLASIIIFTFLFLYIIQHNRISRKNLEQKTILLEKEKLSQELEYKSKELTTSVMYLLKKNEFISSISDKLRNISLDSTEKHGDAIDKIISQLDKSISEGNWDDFEARFQEVHIGFYNKLCKEFPAVSPSELRLCAFLRLNMTTKEIAEITFQSFDSIKTARYRLRKKLGLERDENLVVFLTKY